MPSEQLHTRHLVTISAPYGAGGSIVGPRLAERLGGPFVDRAIPVEVSNRLDMPLDEALTHEQLSKGTISRWITHFAPAVQMFAGAPVTREATDATDEAFRLAAEQVLHEHATTGGVILGRSGAVLLRDVPNALHVRLAASRERRSDRR
jgi:hypothetical protein